MKILILPMLFTVFSWSARAVTIDLKSTTVLEKLVGDYDAYKFIQYTFIPMDAFCKQSNVSLYYSSCQVFSMDFIGQTHHVFRDNVSTQYEVKVQTGDYRLTLWNQTQVTVLVKGSGLIIVNGHGFAHYHCPLRVNQHDEFDRVSVTLEKAEPCQFQVIIDPFVRTNNSYYLRRVEGTRIEENMTWPNETEIVVPPVVVVQRNWNFYATNIAVIVIGVMFGTIIFTIFYCLSPIKEDKRHKIGPAPDLKPEKKKTSKPSKNTKKTDASHVETSTSTVVKRRKETFASTTATAPPSSTSHK